MTVETTERKTAQSMTASIVNYTFVFRALASAPGDIKCIRTNDSTNVDEDMTRVTEIPVASSASDVLSFLVSVNTDGVGGTITVAWPSTNSTITIYRETTDTQGSDYEDYNQFPAETVETDLDKRTMRSQEQQEDLARSLKVAITASTGSTLPTGEANTYLGWDATGTILENKTIATGGTILVKAGLSDAVAKTSDTLYMTPYGTGHAMKTIGTINITTTATIADLNLTGGIATALTVTTVNLSSGTIAGAVTGVTQSADDNSTALATTAYADAAVSTGSGIILQMVNTMSTLVNSGTTVMVKDDSVPTNTEGDEYMTLAITPTITTSTLKIDVVCNVGNSATNYMIVALYQDSTAAALAAVGNWNGNNGNSDPIVFTHYMPAGGLPTTTTFKVRAGLAASGTTTFNGGRGAQWFGGTFASSITITEISA